MTDIEKYKSFCKSYLTNKIEKCPYSIKIFRRVSKEYSFNVDITLFPLKNVDAKFTAVGEVSINIVFLHSNDLSFKENMYIHYINDKWMFYDHAGFQESLITGIVNRMSLIDPNIKKYKRYNECMCLVGSFKEIIDKNYRTLFLEGLFGAFPENTLTNIVDD